MVEFEEEKRIESEDCMIYFKGFKYVYDFCLTLHKLFVLVELLRLVFHLSEFEHFVLILEAGTNCIERLLV